MRASRQVERREQLRPARPRRQELLERLPEARQVLRPQPAERRRPSARWPRHQRRPAPELQDQLVAPRRASEPQLKERVLLPRRASPLDLQLPPQPRAWPPERREVPLQARPAWLRDHGEPPLPPPPA